MWHCRCDCGKEKDISGWHLTSGKIQSCGCLQKEIAQEANTKRNTYDLTGDIGVGFLNNSDKTFIFDKEDIDKISNYTWYLSNTGYVVTSTVRNVSKIKLLHRVIMNLPDDDNRCVDHINHDTLDNRKVNLRICTISNNHANQKKSSRNTSNVVGVDFISRLNKWRARIRVNYKDIHLGTYNDFNKAVKARKQAEEKYFGDYSYDNSMNIAQKNKLEQ